MAPVSNLTTFEAFEWGPECSLWASTAASDLSAIYFETIIPECLTPRDLPLPSTMASESMFLSCVSLLIVLLNRMLEVVLFKRAGVILVSSLQRKPRRFLARTSYWKSETRDKSNLRATTNEADILSLRADKRRFVQRIYLHKKIYEIVIANESLVRHYSSTGNVTAAVWRMKPWVWE